MVALLAHELHAVDKQAVHNGYIVWIVEVVDKRSDDADVHSRTLKLIERIWIIYTVPQKSAGRPCRSVEESQALLPPNIMQGADPKRD